MTARTEARVRTDRSARYGKQLAAHLGRRNGGEWDDAAERGWIQLGSGRADLSCTADALLITVEADAESVGQLEDVVGRHLVRFGTRDELVVTWVREGGEPGTEQRAEPQD
jgi:uncharacterized protein